MRGERAGGEQGSAAAATAAAVERQVYFAGRRDETTGESVERSEQSLAVLSTAL